VNSYLLDTHILLWSLLEPQRLSQNAALELDDVANEMWISPITTSRGQGPDAGIRPPPVRSASFAGHRKA
jgi:hypothetical protein